MKADLIGQRLGDFEVICELGRGGMGVVYEARQVSLNRPVALKILGPGFGLTPRAVERFHREAEAAARLHHSNIVPVYATGEQDGIHFYAMELIDGPSLDAVIRDLRDGPSALPPNLAATGAYVPGASTPTPTGSGSGSSADRFDRAATMIADVADALHHAHLNGVTHRDIKPSNLLLSADGRLSVTDFGLARMLEQPGMTVTGEFVGTPAYMSPEQITAGRIPVDHRTDIYSLGATLYELLTLRPPFVTDGRDRLLAMVIQKEPEPPRRVNPKVPRDLETICLKCLEKDPDRRYASAKELADDLRRYVNRFAILAKRTGPIAKLKKWVKRNPVVTAMIGLAVFAVGMAGFFAYESWRRGEEQAAAELKARVALRDEKMRQAQQRVLQGDFPRAEDSIRGALELGAPSEWADWRRGQIAYHQGELGQAIERLERAVAKLPENTAAQALLASACIWSGHWDKYNRVRDALLSPPVTVEDMLYLGLAYSYADPTEGLRLLDLAVKEDSSLIAHVIRAQVRADQAMHTSDWNLANEAIGDAIAAKVTLPDNPTALCISAWVHQIAATLCPPTEPAERDRALATVRKEADALARFPNLPWAVLVRGWSLDAVGQEDEAARVWATQPSHPIIAGLYAQYFYRRGETSQAQAIVTTHFSATPSDRVYRDWFFAENLERHPAILANLQEYTASLPAWRRPSEYGHLMFLLGRKAEATVAARRDLAQLGQAPPLFQSTFGNLAKYLMDPTRTAEDTLVQAAGRSKRQQISAHFLIGLSRLADGDRIGARERFEAAVAIRCFYNESYDWSRTFLARMKQDETWPSWIKNPKK